MLGNYDKLPKNLQKIYVITIIIAIVLIAAIFFIFNFSQLIAFSIVILILSAIDLYFVPKATRGKKSWLISDLCYFMLYGFFLFWLS